MIFIVIINLQLTRTESTSTSQDLQMKTLKSRVSELESFQQSVEKECDQLRKDKLLLIDHVSEIQRKVCWKGTTLLRLTWWLSHVEHELFTLPEHLSSPPVFNGVWIIIELSILYPVKILVHSFLELKVSIWSADFLFFFFFSNLSNLVQVHDLQTIENNDYEYCIGCTFR